MLVRGVIRHEVDEHADSAAVRLLEEAVEIPERAEGRIDVAVIGYVVAEVLHRRPIERRDPDRVDAERGRRAVVQVVETAGDAGEIADAVTVRILK